MKEDLGLNEADSKLLCEQVSIVFHCAATVKFDEALRVAIQMNVIGTQRLIALSHKMQQLIVRIIQGNFVHSFFNKGRENKGTITFFFGAGVAYMYDKNNKIISVF